MNEVPTDDPRNLRPAEADRGVDDVVDEVVDEAALDRELAAGDDLLSAQLRRLLDPGEELGTRTAVDVGRALRSRSVAGATLDLLGTGWWTARALLTDDRASADEEPERT